MKGMVDTKDVLKPLVKKENGLHTGRSMCVFSYNEVPQMNKLLALADGGMIMYPTLEQKKRYYPQQCRSPSQVGYRKSVCSGSGSGRKGESEDGRDYRRSGPGGNE